MDLSAVKLYENRAVADAGAEAVTQGSRIAFAPGKLDFSSSHGQALLGHEMSHVASQARGEVRGSGLVKDPALEARADREGLRAARGERISLGYGGANAALSNASAASAAGPMQAKSGKKKQDETDDSYYIDQEINYYKDDFDKNGIVTGESTEGVKKPFRAEPVKRNGLKRLYDSFRTTGSHWFTGLRNFASKKKMNRMDLEMANMVSLEDAEKDNAFDIFIMPGKKKEEEEE